MASGVDESRVVSRSPIPAAHPIAKPTDRARANDTYSVRPRPARCKTKTPTLCGESAFHRGAKGKTFGQAHAPGTRYTHSVTAYPTVSGSSLVWGTGAISNRTP